MKIEDIKLGETYYFPYRSNQIYLFKLLKYEYNDKYLVSKGINKDSYMYGPFVCICSNSIYENSTNLTIIKDFLSVDTRLATKEESEHLELCITANKYVNYYKPTQDEINLNNLIEQSKNLIFKT